MIEGICINASDGQCFGFNWSARQVPSYIQSTPAGSASGKYNYQIMDFIIEYISKTITDVPDSAKFQRELEDILRECSYADWDGYGAEPVDPESMQLAREFMQKLVTYNIPYPEPSVLPDGNVAMEWYSKGYNLVVSIDNEKKISWGGTSPSGRISGNAELEHYIPYEIVTLLRMIEYT